ncbi:hypothetical protein ACJX0J_015840, partial [Zea mays]
MFSFSLRTKYNVACSCVMYSWEISGKMYISSSISSINYPRRLGKKKKKSIEPIGSSEASLDSPSTFPRYYETFTFMYIQIISMFCFHIFLWYFNPDIKEAAPYYQSVSTQQQKLT